MISLKVQKLSLTFPDDQFDIVDDQFKVADDQTAAKDEQFEKCKWSIWRFLMMISSWLEVINLVFADD